MTEARLKELFDKHHRDLLKYAYSIIGEQYESEDIVQNAFIYLWQKSLTGTLIEIKAPNYLWVFVKCRCYTYLEAKEVRKAGKEIYANTYIEKTTYFEVDPFAINWLRKKIEQLSPKRKRIMSMIILEGMSQKEVSDRLLCTKACVSIAYKESASMISQWSLKECI